MFRYLRVKKRRDPIVQEVEGFTLAHLLRDPSAPLTLRQLNSLQETAIQRVYRALFPTELLARFKIDPITGQDADHNQAIHIQAGPETGVVRVQAFNKANAVAPFFDLEISDNAINGIDLNLIQLSDPEKPYFQIDYDDEGKPTLFGTLHRNLAAEEQAMQAGLAPGQISPGLKVSRGVFGQLEAFLAALGHRAYFLEPLTYASAWVFERRGFAYVRGHKLMEDIHSDFQPGGRPHQGLDGSTPFRTGEQWRTVRGRAWAIHDGLLEHIDARWDNLRMVKQLGRHAGVETFPQAVY